MNNKTEPPCNCAECAANLEAGCAFDDTPENCEGIVVRRKSPDTFESPNSAKEQQACGEHNKQMDVIAVCKKAAYLISMFDHIDKGSWIHKQLMRF